MPNHVENSIYIKYGEFTKEQIDKIKKEFCRENGSLDFNKFIPQPDNTINVALGANTVIEYSAFFKYNPLNYNEEMMKKVLNCDVFETFEENKEPIIVDGLRIDLWISKWYDENKYELAEEDILPDWYSWNTKVWGTKWNAYDGSIEPSGIYFTTANSEIHWLLREAIVRNLKEILEPKQWESLVYSFNYEENDYLIYCDEIGRRYMNDEWCY